MRRSDGMRWGSSNDCEERSVGALRDKMTRTIVGVGPTCNKDRVCEACETTCPQARHVGPREFRGRGRFFFHAFIFS